MLSWRRTGSFLLTNASCRHFSFQCISLIYILLRCRGFTRIQKAVVDQTGSRPANSDHDHFWFKFGFGKCFGASWPNPELSHLQLLYEIHFYQHSFLGVHFPYNLLIPFCTHSCLSLCDCQNRLSVGFSRQEYWSGLPLPPSRGSSGPKDRTRISCLLHCHVGSLPLAAAAVAKSLQSCLTLLDPMNCSLPGSSIHGIFPGKSTGVGCNCFLYYH